MQPFSLSDHCAHSFWQVTEALWNAGTEIHVRKWSLSSPLSPRQITVFTPALYHCGVPTTPQHKCRTCIRVEYLRPQLSHSDRNAPNFTNHGQRFWNHCTAPLWWQQSISSHRHQILNFQVKPNMTRPWEESREMKEAALWATVHYLDYLPKQAWNYWSLWGVSTAICASEN